MYVTGLLLLLICFSVQQNSIVRTEDIWTVVTSEVLTVYQQHVITAFRYPNLSEIINGPNKGLHACLM